MTNIQRNKHKMLDSSYTHFKEKQLDWCPDLSTGTDVWFNSGFEDRYCCICWGMVK